MRLLALLACLPLAAVYGSPREQRREQVRRREAQALRRALEVREREEEAGFEKEVRDHPGDRALQEEWRVREEHEKVDRATRAEMLRNNRPLDPRTAPERGERGVVRLTFDGGACSGVVVGATGSTSLVLTRARCVADLSVPAAPRMRALRVEFPGAATAGTLTQKIHPAWLEALARGAAPQDGTDLALVVANAPPPPGFALLMILQEPAERLRALAGKPLQVVGFGQPEAEGAPGRVADVERFCAEKPCEGRTNALLLQTDGARQACTDADAGGAVTVFYPPAVFLLAINDAHPARRGGCVSHPLSSLGSAPLAWVAQNALANDFKTCIRDPRTARVTCRDSVPGR